MSEIGGWSDGLNSLLSSNDEVASMEAIVIWYTCNQMRPMKKYGCRLVPDKKNILSGGYEVDRAFDQNVEGRVFEFRQLQT